MSYYCYIMFIPMIFISNILIFFVSSWFSMWMIMELNMISFISLLMFDKSIKFEILMNYFLVQVYNSFMFLLCMVLMNYFEMSWVMMIMYMSILMKLGMPPFYNWYMKIISNLSWVNILILMIFQKIILLIIISYIVNSKELIYLNMLMMLYSGVIGSVKGMSQLHLKVLMGYSSIIHMSWVIMLMMVSEEMSMIYFMMYSFISFLMLLIFNYYNLTSLMSMFMLSMMNNFNYYVILVMMMSLASMPPFFGFMMKLMGIIKLSEYLNFIYMVLFILWSLISMFYYLRVSYMIMLFSSIKSKIMFKFIVCMNSNINLKFSWIMWMLLVMFISYDMF